MTEMKLDFSQFHPLDHRPGSKRCRDHYPRGWKSLPYCLKMHWDYKWRAKVMSRTLCKLGRHEFTPWWRGRGGPLGETRKQEPDGYNCVNCWTPRKDEA